MNRPTFFNPIAKKASTIGSIQQATPKDANAVNTLRLAAYESATEFRVKDKSHVVWNEQDPVLLVNRLEKPIATLQGKVLATKEQAEQYLNMKLPLAADKHFPALYLSFAATDSEYRNSGIHTLLRQYFLQAAESNLVNSMIGIVFADATRTKSMREMGYEFRNIDFFGPSHVNPKREPLIALLKKDKFEFAQNYLMQKNKAIMANYPWQGELLLLEQQNTPIVAQCK